MQSRRFLRGTLPVRLPILLLQCKQVPHGAILLISRRNKTALKAGFVRNNCKPLGQISAPIATAVSDMRFEKPHSLSYQVRMRTMVPSITLVWSM